MTAAAPRRTFLFWYTMLFLVVGKSTTSANFDYHQYLDSVTTKAKVAFDQVSDSLYVDPYEQENEEKDFKDLILPATRSVGMAAYGVTLLLHSHDFRGQVHLITMLRSTGFDKISRAVRELKRNVRRAVLSVVWNSPSFAMGTKSMTHLDDRVRDAKKILSETRQARADGIVTAKEANRLKRLKKREIKRFQRDMKRLARAGSSLGKVWKALDLDEIVDISKNFMFQLLAVLASSGDEDAPGKRQKMVGQIVSRWCVFINLGTLLLDTNSKLGYPIAKYIHGQPMFQKAKKERNLVMIEKTAEFVMFSSAGCLVLVDNASSRRLNAALASSAVTLRGIRNLVNTICWDQVDVDDNIIITAVARLGTLLEGTSGGLLMLALTSIGLVCRYRAERGKDTIKLPKWILKPVNATENLIDKVAERLDDMF